MALRHPVPVFRWGQFGDGEGAPVRRVAAPVCVRFVRDGSLDEIMAARSTGADLVVEAACGAGKSVRLPVAMLGAGVDLLLHVVPSQNLAASLAQYVAAANPGTPVHFVPNGSEAPGRKGLLIMSAVQYIWLITSWREQRLDVSYTLYFDEAQESDWVTSAIRDLRSQLWGCESFMMASATMGHGGPGEPYMPADPAGGVTEVQYSDVDPLDWDIYSEGMPWSAAEITTDTVIYIDNEDRARHVTDMFAMAGFNAHRLVAATSPEDYLAIQRNMAVAAGSVRLGLTVLVVDYSYRSGYTFPTVGTVIDTCEVENVEADTELGDVVLVRKAYVGEVVQTRGRVGRIAGKPGYYYRPSYEPQPIVTMLQGSEFDASVLLYRVLGFKPPHWARGTPFYAGDLPQGFPQALRGKVPLRCVQGRQPWPASPLRLEKKAEVVTYPPAVDESTRPELVVSPVSRRGSVVVSVCSDPDDSGVGFGDGDGVGRRSREKSKSARAARRAAVRDSSSEAQVGRTPLELIPADVGPGVGPAFSSESVKVGRVTAKLDQAFESLLGKHASAPVKLRLGRYYYFTGALARPTRYNDFAAVEKVWGPNVDVALRAAAPSVLLDAQSAALLTFNKASVVEVVAAQVLEQVGEFLGGSPTVAACVRRFVVDLRNSVDVARASATRAADFLMAQTDLQLVKADSGTWRAEELTMVNMLMTNLVTMVEAEKPVPSRVTAYTEQAMAGYVAGGGGAPVGLSGRYQLDLGRGGLRERLAGRLVGNKATANVVYDTGGFTPSQVLTRGQDALMHRLRGRFDL